MHDLDLRPAPTAPEVDSRIPGVRRRSVGPYSGPAASPEAAPSELVRTRIVPHGARFVHAVVLVDPRPEWLPVVRRMRAHGAPVLLLSARRLEPTTWARGARRHRMPPLEARPARWEACLLELAARLEPRPLLFTCSPAAGRYLRGVEHRLRPHYVLANEPLASDADPALADPDRALRRAVELGDAALEVQMVRDGSGRLPGVCVLAWAPGAAPDVLVSSVSGSDIVARSEAWAQARGLVGYARLVWAPDRFGKLVLQAASALPGPGLQLALDDGVDFPALAYAAALGWAAPVQSPRLGTVRRLSLLDPGPGGEGTPLVQFATRPCGRDPLPWLAALLRGLVRS